MMTENDCEDLISFWWFHSSTFSSSCSSYSQIITFYNTLSLFTENITAMIWKWNKKKKKTKYNRFDIYFSLTDGSCTNHLLLIAHSRLYNSINRYKSKSEQEDNKSMARHEILQIQIFVPSFFPKRYAMNLLLFLIVSRIRWWELKRWGESIENERRERNLLFKL